MDAERQAEATLREALPWVKLTLDYTDRLAAAIPEDLLDWRPEDPSGKWSFSLVEIVKHVSDARFMFIGQLDGEDPVDETGDAAPDRYWSAGPGADGEWNFYEHKDKAEVLARLAQARQPIEQWLDRPASGLMDITDGTRAVFEMQIKRLQESGVDVADWHRRGPATVNRVLMALAVHEAGHRAALQTLLRQKGINVEGAE